jgi:hypothetical protein
MFFEVRRIARGAEAPQQNLGVDNRVVLKRVRQFDFGAHCIYSLCKRSFTFQSSFSLPSSH